MELNDLRIAVTLASFVLFVVLALSTWSVRRRRAHDEAAALPFAGETDDARGGTK
jgi:hypothetical protein